MSAAPTDFWTSYAPMASVIGGFATAAAAVIGALALLFAWKQIRTARDVSSEKDAQETYSDYLKICFENPELTCDTLAAETLPSKSLDGLGDQVTKESERYVWFLSILLSANEKIYFSCPKDEAWLHCVQAQISYHVDALNKLWPSMKGHFSPKFRKVVEEVLANA